VEQTTCICRFYVKDLLYWKLIGPLLTFTLCPNRLQRARMPDEYSEKINKYWDEITGMYILFEDKKPIIELEPNRIRIIAFPAEEYLDGLSERNREQSRKQYQKATATGAMMVFVRDEEKDVLRSYVFPRVNGK